MNLYDLGRVPWPESQLIYHALPRLGQEGLIFLRPASPYVCIGYHQDLEQEVDVAYCREKGIPIFRREVGGGAVYLDGNQLFYQLILHRGHPLAAQTKESFYRQLLAPVVSTYQALGIEARYKPVNDIITAEGRKISGNGAAEIGDYWILVGNLIADFDYETMVRILKVPDEKYRDKVHKSLQENLTTMRRELGKVPSWRKMRAVLRQEFEKVLGPLQEASLPAGVADKVAELKPLFFSEDWLYKRGRRLRDRTVKIASGTEVRQRLYKAPGGLIRAISEVKDGRLVSVSLSGDFFFYPAEKLDELEKHLEQVPLAEVEEAIAAFYRQHQIESPGVTPADLSQVLVS